MNINKLIFLLDPTEVVADLSQTTLRKVLRFVSMSAYSNTCAHIPGSEIVWAQFLSRWRVAGHLVCRIITVPVLPSSSDRELKWPSTKDPFQYLM